jgi:hypothetical protein
MANLMARSVGTLFQNIKSPAGSFGFEHHVRAPKL